MQYCRKALAASLLLVFCAAAAAAEQKGVTAHILSVVPAGPGSSVLHLNRGSRHGLRRGMKGLVDGDGEEVVLIKVGGRRSEALARQNPERLRAKSAVEFHF